MSESSAGNEPLPQLPAAVFGASAQTGPAPSNAADLALPRERLAGWAWFVAAVALLLGLFYLLAPILTPFALAGVLAYVLQPGVDSLQRRDLPRTLASARYNRT